jgi:hypothetical protein
MSIVQHNRQLLALVILALVLTLSFFAVSAHVGGEHALFTLSGMKPNIMYPYN